MRIRPSSESEVRMEITPLIDILFTLIIFFLATATFREQEFEDMDLADKKKSQSKEQPKFIVINVQEDGGLTLRGDEVELKSLEAVLKRERRSDPGAKVLVRGHVKAHFGKVADVFLISKNAGFLKATIGYDAVQ